MKYKSFLFVILILIMTLGLFFRLIGLDKPEGLWNDEYVSYMIASIPIGKGFFKGMLEQCHMPIYYLYLKSAMVFFGDSDLVLRFTSVFAGMLSIVSMFFVGRKAKGNLAGIICATVTALSSFLIYYSQEVRFYSLLFFFSSLLLLFTLRLNKVQSKANAVGYVVSSLLVIFTHTIGFVFVFFNLIFTTVWLLKVSEKNLKPLFIAWAGVVLTGLLASPFVVNILLTSSFNQWWGTFTTAKLGFLFTDYFSPVLTNLVNSPDNFFYNRTFGFLLFAICPTLIAITGIVKSLQKREYRGLFLVCAATVGVLMIAALLGKLVFITKYSVEIYPVLILLMVVGLLEFKNRALTASLIAAFLLLNVFYLNNNDKAVMKIRNNQGHKIVADLLNNASLNEGDVILTQYYDKSRFEKYFDFEKYIPISLNKGNFNQYIVESAPNDNLLKDGKAMYKSVFVNDENEFFKKNLDEIVINKMKKGQQLAVVVFNASALFSPVQLKSIALDEKVYNKTPFLFLVFSYLKNQTLKECMEKLRITRYETKGAWGVIVFEKE